MKTYVRLKHNKSTEIARELIFFDCETQDYGDGTDAYETHRLWFGVAYHCRLITKHGKIRATEPNKIVFYTKEEFWEWLFSITQANMTSWVFAHNAGFDLTQVGFWERIQTGDLKITFPGGSRNSVDKSDDYQGLFLLEDPPTAICCDSPTGNRFLFLDTLNYYRISLAVLGESLGIPKLEMPDRDAPFDRWIEYCERDVEVIFIAITSLIAWWKEQELGKWRWTTPGLAMAAFRHKFYAKAIDCPQDPDIRRLERRSYYGGQLEAYRIGHFDEESFQYDVNSLYPSVMHGNVFPTALARCRLDGELLDDPPDWPIEHCVADVEMYSPEETFPCRTENGVCYVNGTGLTTLAGPELRYAYDKGYIRKWCNWSAYHVAPLFDDYVTFFWNLKQEYEESGDKVKRTFVKLMLNSLYGKFGQRGSRWELNKNRTPQWNFGLWTARNVVTKKEEKWLCLYDVCIDWVEKGEVQVAFPAISSFVTAYARQHMRQLKDVAGHENIWYMSTDSLLMNRLGSDRLHAADKIHDKALGCFSLEKQASSSWVGALHYYGIGDKVIEGAKKQTSDNERDLTWTEPQFDSISTVIERHGVDSIRIRNVEKTRSLSYTKGQVGPGGIVSPFTFADLDRLDKLEAS